MQTLFFIVLAAAIAAVMLAFQRTGKSQSPPPPEPPPEPDPRQLEDAAEGLGAALDALLALMAHPRLGGPGFLMVRFPPAAEGGPVAEAQFPNIQEALYRRILQGRTDRAELVRAGAPEALFSCRPVFAAESGGMVLLSLQTPGLDPALAELLDSRRGRSQVLGGLAERLGRRYPDLTVRCLGNSLLLTPNRP